MGVVEDKGCRKDKAFLTLWHLCLEWRFFFCDHEGLHNPWKKELGSFFSSMSCSFMIDASGGSRLGFFPML